VASKKQTFASTPQSCLAPASEQRRTPLPKALPTQHSVVIEPVSADRLYENGNFCCLGWRLSANSREGCRFLVTKDFRQSHKNPVKCGTFGQ
jgi:hypothetical protein